MIKFRLFLLLIIYTFISCDSISYDSQNGYSDLDKLYSDFVLYLKDSNPENLKNYCHAIIPDKETVSYMKKNKISYRGIPEELEKRKIEPSYLADNYYAYILAFKQELIRKNQLNSLKYLGREREGEELLNERLKIYITETIILMESRGDTIRFKLGEMLRINNKWKSFTLP